MRQFDYSKLKDKLKEICDAYNRAVGESKVDPLILIPVFIHDFLCIHPFIDGNKGSYYDALELSQNGWHEEQDDPTPFIKYLLGTIISAYHDFEDRMEIISPSSEDTVRKAVESRIGKFTKREIVELCPNISTSTVERNLRAMVNRGELEKQGAGKSTFYTRRF